MSKKVLIVASNPATSTTTGWPVGFWAAELTHPYDALTKAGHEVVIASPDGGEIKPDGLSDPDDESGYSKDDELSRKYLTDDSFKSLIANTPKVSDQSVEDFDAIMVVGGQGPMITFKDATSLHEKFIEFDKAGKFVSALCHGTCLLLYLKKEDGSPYVAGRKMTGFTNAEEDAADAAVGQKIAPFRIETLAIEAGADFQTAEPFHPFAIRDGRLITGQQQISGAETARLLLEALSE